MNFSLIFDYFLKNRSFRMISRYKSGSSKEKHSKTQSITARTSAKACVLCTIALSFPITIHKALYTKFASSQNYYYTREINDILLGNRSQRLIKFNDFATFDEESEFLKRFYAADEYFIKMRVLTEYYKYHKDIARLFMLPITRKLNKYHDKRRRFDYIKITKIIKEQEKVKGNQEFPGSSEEVQGNYREISGKMQGNCNVLEDMSENMASFCNSNATIEEWKQKLKEITMNYSRFHGNKESFTKELARNHSSFGEETAFSLFLQGKNSECCEKNREIVEKIKKKCEIIGKNGEIIGKIEKNREIIGENKQKSPSALKVLRKWPLAKKLALLSKNSKGNLAPFTERNPKKVQEEEENTAIMQRNSPVLAKNVKNTTKNLKMDHKILDLIMRTLLKQRKSAEIPLKTALKTEKLPAKTQENAEKTVKTHQTLKKRVASPTNSTEKPIISPKTLRLGPFASKNSDFSKKMRQRIYSNEISKRNSQPNPLYFEKKPENIENIENFASFSLTQRLKTSRNGEKTPESSQTNCLTERNLNKNARVFAKTKAKPQKTAKITHKYTKSEPKLLKTQQVLPRNLSPSSIFPQKGSKILNIFVKSPENGKKSWKKPKEIALNFL